MYDERERGRQQGGDEVQIYRTARPVDQTRRWGIRVNVEDACGRAGYLIELIDVD